MPFDISNAEPVGDSLTTPKKEVTLEEVKEPPKSVEEKYSSEEYEAPKKPYEEYTKEERNKLGREIARQERMGFGRALQSMKAGATEYLAKGAEAIGLADPGTSEAIIKKEAEREKEYQKQTPMSHGIVRGVTSAIPALATGGESLLAQVGGGVLASQLEPVRDTSEKSFGQQKLEQAGWGAGIPAAIRAVPSGIKYLMRGGKEAAEKMLKNLEDFKISGVERPTMAQVTEGGMASGKYVSPKVIERQEPQVAARVESLAGREGFPFQRKDVAKTSEEAGKVVQEAIVGKPETELLKLTKTKTVESPTGKKVGGWQNDVRDEENRLHEKWQSKVGLDIPIFMPTFRNTLLDLIRPAKGAEETTSEFINKKLQDIYEGFKRDSAGTMSLPLKGVEKIRKSIGELTDPSMEARISTKQHNALYAALKNDIANAVDRVGPKAKALYNDAFEYSRQAHDVSENIMSPLAKSGILQDIMPMIMDNTKEGVETIRTLLKGSGEIKGLGKHEADVVRSVALRRLGNTDRGDFDSDAFFKNWGDMHKDVKQVLFGEGKGKIKEGLDRVYNVISKMPKTKPIEAIDMYGVKHEIAKKAMGGPIVAALTGKMISNPVIVNWLAQTVTKVPSQLPAALIALKNRSQNMSQDDQDEVEKYLENVQKMGE